MRRLSRYLAFIFTILSVPLSAHAQEGYAGIYGTPNPDRSGSFIASNASGSTAFQMNLGARLLFDSTGSNYLSLVSTTLTSTGITALQVGQLNANTLTATAFSLGLTLTGAVANSGTAVGTIIDNGVALSTAGAKTLSIRNNGAEKNSFDKDGYLFFPTSIGIAWGTPSSITASIFYDGANHISFSIGAGVLANQYSNGNTGAPNIMQSNRTNGAAAIGTNINTAATFNIAGQKLLNITNNSVEKMAWDLNGKPITTFTDTSGTPGSGTANTVCGRSAIANTASAATITNSNSVAGSQVFIQMETSGVGVGNIVAAPGVGSFVATSINALGVATATTGTLVFSWCVKN